LTSNIICFIIISIFIAIAIIFSIDMDLTRIEKN